MGRAEYKVPGGKLLSAESKVNDDLLVDVKITGDFFMHPEEAILELENMLKGKKLNTIEDTVISFFKYNEVTLFGVEPESFVHVIKLSLNQCS